MTNPITRIALVTGATGAIGGAIAPPGQRRKACAIGVDLGQVAGGIPTYRPAGNDDVEEGCLAAWQPHDPEHEEGVVLLNIDGDDPARRRGPPSRLVAGEEVRAKGREADEGSEDHQVPTDL